MEDLILNAHTLFDERPSPSPQSVMGFTTRHRPGPVYGIPMSTQSSFSSLPLDAAMESRFTTSPTRLLSPLLGLPSSKTLPEGVEMTGQEQVIPEVQDTEAVETLTNSTPVESVPMSVAAWRLEVRQSQLPPEAMTMPQSPSDSESVLSGTSGFPLSSATSLRTRMGPFSP